MMKSIGRRAKAESREKAESGKRKAESSLAKRQGKKKAKASKEKGQGNQPGEAEGKQSEGSKPTESGKQSGKARETRLRPTRRTGTTGPAGTRTRAAKRRRGWTTWRVARI